MKVSELIAKLEDVDPDFEVYVPGVTPLSNPTLLTRLDTDYLFHLDAVYLI
jgi:hypothetical protein